MGFYVLLGVLKVVKVVLIVLALIILKVRQISLNFMEVLVEILVCI